MPDRITTYREFWPHYLRAHRCPGTRALHYFGTGTGLALVAAAILTARWWLALLGPLFGYACAWLAHFAIEGNRPATFGHPVWSLYSDIRMLVLWASGRLSRELDRARQP
jgi:hypothetical protein